MARKKLEVKKEEVIEEVEVPEVSEHGNNEQLEKISQLKNPSTGVFCKHCNRDHEKTFNGVGINHEPFDVGSKADVMFKILCDQPKQPLFIPYEIGEKVGAITSPQINGLKINLLKGRYIQVPQQVAEVVMVSLNQTAAALDSVRVWNKDAGEYRNPKLDLRSEAHRGRLDA